MEKLKIEFFAPSGKELEGGSNIQFYNRLSEEIEDFAKVQGSENVQHSKSPAEEGTLGLPELFTWAITIYHLHGEEIKNLLSFLASLKTLIKLFWPEIPKEPIEEDNRLVITYKDKKLTLPCSDKNFNQFLKSIEKFSEKKNQ